MIETDQARSARMAEMQQRYEQSLMQLQKEGKPENTLSKPQLEERRLPKISNINKMLYTLSNLSCKPGPAFFSALTVAWRKQFK